MYDVNATIIYGSEGVCKVTEIRNMKFGEFDEMAPYYILSPISNPTSKIFVPCNNEFLVSKIKDVLSAEEIIKMIKSSDELPEWIDDNRQRNKAFKEILNTYDRKQILCLAKLLCIVKEEKSDKRKLYSSDEELLKKILKILHSEFSIVFEISLEEISQFIFGKIDCPKR